MQLSKKGFHNNYFTVNLAKFFVITFLLEYLQVFDSDL